MVHHIFWTGPLYVQLGLKRNLSENLHSRFFSLFRQYFFFLKRSLSQHSILWNVCLHQDKIVPHCCTEECSPGGFLITHFYSRWSSRYQWLLLLCLTISSSLQIPKEISVWNLQPGENTAGGLDKRETQRSPPRMQISATLSCYALWKSQLHLSSEANNISNNCWKVNYRAVLIREHLYEEFPAMVVFGCRMLNCWCWISQERGGWRVRQRPADTQGHEDDEDGEEDATEQLLGVVWVHQRKKGEGCLSAATIIASPCRDCLHPSTQAEPKTDLF